MIAMLGPSAAVLLPKNNVLIRSIEFGMMWNPHFGVVYSFIKTLYRYQFYSNGQGSSVDPWGYDSGCFVQLVGFAASIVVYPILTFMIEYNYCKCKRGARRLKDDLSYEGPREKDKDVLAEEERVQKILNGEIEPETITVHKLMKRFKTLKVKKPKNEV